MGTTIIYTVLEYFLVFSFLGWCVEVAYQAVSKGLVVNRGFLNGPVCPIYGFGVLAVFRMLESAGDGNLYEQNAFKVFLFGVVLATAIELFGGWMLDKLFHARWWDYSDQPFNLHGYICLEFSIIWGLGILLVVRGVNPTVTHLLGLVPVRVGWALIAIFSAIFIADVIVSVMVMAGLNKRMAEIDEMRARMRVVSNDLSERIGSRAIDTAQHIDEAKVQASLARTEVKAQASLARTEVKAQASLAVTEAKDHMEQLHDDYEARRRELINRLRESRHFGAGRLLRAFPEMRHRDHQELIEMIRREIKE
jgi:uncharacterized membrane protein